MIPGKDIKLGGETYTVPPLTLGALQRFQAKLTSYSGSLSAEDVQTVIDVATAALKRNYPDLTAEQVADMIDLGNIQEVFMAVMSVSGLVPTGEAQAAPVNP
jgi:uncharacterized protein (DUF433 family)